MNTSTPNKNWDRLDKASVLALQGKLLNRYLRRIAIPFSRHYGKIFRDHGISPRSIRRVEDLQKIPFTSKEDLLPEENNPHKINAFTLLPDPSSRVLRGRLLRQALWRGKRRTKDTLEREFRPTFMTATTGRSTEPIPFLYTQQDLKNLSVAGGRIIEIGKAQGEDILLNLFPYAPHLAYWQVFFAGLEKNRFCLGSGGGKVTGTEGSIALIRKLRPTVLIGMPTFIYHVLNQALEEGETFRSIRLILLGGEKVVPGTRRKLTGLCADLGSPTIRTAATYGFTEAKMAWPECPTRADEDTAGYHLYPDLGIIEIIDPETGAPAPEGEGGEIVFTPLQARGTVVLRYRTGDLIDGGLIYEPCPCCGRRLPRLRGTISRLSDRQTMQLGKVKGTLVDFNALECFLDNFDPIGSWQLELRKINNDPLELDELILHVNKRGEIDNRALSKRVLIGFARATEVRPNRIVFHTPEGLRGLQQVGRALKEKKILDNRTPPPQGASAKVRVRANGASIGKGPRG